jgi:hypothetical protein
MPVLIRLPVLKGDVGSGMSVLMRLPVLKGDLVAARQAYARSRRVRAGCVCELFAHDYINLPP